jgi:diadenosine tetraphosphatase ApaH/serine/threonine PP2A family protein phosphatase
VKLSETADKAIIAYGGHDLWQNAGSVETEVSADGLAFVLKRRPCFRHSIMTMDAHQPVCRFTPIGRNTSITGVLDGGDVRLENERGQVVSERRSARDYFKVGRRLFYWDDLDMCYFANYASWNYFTLPALLMRDDIAWSETGPGVLQARFPDTIPTHSRVQQFRFDIRTGLLIQHDYTADIISPLARASNVVVRHSTNVDGLVYPSERVVTPRSPKGNPLPGPVLIHLILHDYRVIGRQRT